MFRIVAPLARVSPLGFFEEAVGSKVYLNGHSISRNDKGVRL